ncbi:ArsR family transcriptional regulator [Halorubrum ezzemoulense]|uniref:Transcriptional regulator n=2 Tax=Halorubrum ezzemoulense TaxID=337243 RepID=A0A256JDE1_HALEZ|nr:MULTISPECIES: ArsR family transcriptional regulator [Halorubrum]MDB2223371.1 ArsR family transcriptional regulator [Halorubrum ezzemoulense]MDB2237664.1 ArsR family transcriptional regulator [Halorubrum ezzemoulense]MDB2240741.1 ArsR family transcriptional regulator [Halorubrum ezzemoulense]MDB2243384.1 ArsR family transcriptional regulator [Halorubrum ezzemoulense]MDB2248842.1 ArsR family transcriptional regulator [Halorubrum ezzemoulense]
MDSAVLLDLLGNENRRRILRLLATKPCYVTEISEYLDVSPKAVIDHLRKLEEAGLVESTTDDQRRKYFRIARSLRLEVSVSPYGFGAKSAYPAKNSLDMSGRCPHLSIEGPDGSGTTGDLAELAEEFTRLQDLDRELSLAQRWVQGRVEDTLAEIDERLGGQADSRFFATVIAAVVETDGTPAAVADEVGARESTVADALRRLSDVGVVARDADGYRVR